MIPSLSFSYEELCEAVYKRDENETVQPWPAEPSEHVADDHSTGDDDSTE